MTDLGQQFDDIFVIIFNFSQPSLEVGSSFWIALASPSSSFSSSFSSFLLHISLPHRGTNLSSHSDASIKVPQGILGICLLHRGTNLSSRSDDSIKVPQGILGICLLHRGTNLSSDDALATLWRRPGDALATL